MKKRIPPTKKLLNNLFLKATQQGLSRDKTLVFVVLELEKRNVEINNYTRTEIEQTFSDFEGA